MDAYPCHMCILHGSLFQTYVATPKCRNKLSLIDFRLFELPVTGSFQRSLTVLYAIGLETYLRLAVDACLLPTPYPRCSTLDTFTSVLSTNTGLSPSMARLSRRLLVDRRRLKEGPQHHISNTFLCRIQFAVYGFQSPLLTAYLLVSFPAGTKTFQSPAFPDLSVLKRSRIRKSPVQPLHTGRRSIKLLVTSFVGVSSQVFPL